MSRKSQRDFLRVVSLTGAFCSVFGTTVVFRGPGIVKDSETWPLQWQACFQRLLPQRRAQVWQRGRVTASTVQRRPVVVPVAR